MNALGVREWVGLAMLGVAAFISFTFLNAGARDNLPPRTPNLGIPFETASPEPTATATPLPPNEIEVPEGSWFVEFYNRDDMGPLVQTFVEALDLSYEGAPFGDFANDDWHMTARTELVLEPGGQVFTLVHDGTVRVQVDGDEVASDTDPSEGPRELVVLFQHPGGGATIRIEAADVGGPFLLRWE
jgi:hypothetical protein